MKRFNTYILLLLAVLAASSCIKEVLPVGGSQTQAQVSESKTAMMSMIKAVPASMTTSGALGYASSYGDHTDFGIPGIHLRFEHMLEDLATMAENPFYNRFYAYDMNEAQGYQYTYCSYFWFAKKLMVPGLPLSIRAKDTTVASGLPSTVPPSISAISFALNSMILQVRFN